MTKPPVPANTKFTEDISIVHYYHQDNDTNDMGRFGQELKIFTEDSGGGNYVIFSTTRWAVDADEIDQFADMLRYILERTKNENKGIL